MQNKYFKRRQICFSIKFISRLNILSYSSCSLIMQIFAPPMYRHLSKHVSQQKLFLPKLFLPCHHYSVSQYFSPFLRKTKAKIERIANRYNLDWDMSKASLVINYSINVIDYRYSEGKQWTQGNRLHHSE